MYRLARGLAFGLIALVLPGAQADVRAVAAMQEREGDSRANREALLREVARAWSGTPYRNHGTTFQGIGNAEFVREVYGAAFDADLAGDPARWRTMGAPVERKKLEPGDLVLYDADPLTHFRKELHAGVYIGDGEFVASVRGAAVAILKLGEGRWKTVFQTARRIEPVPGPRSSPSARSTANATTATAAMGDAERRLRDVEDRWHGTPYKLGGAGKSGIDCSAFSRLLYAEVYHVELPRTVEEQETVGTAVARNRLQAGDLVFFRTQAMGPQFRSRHVGVYLGHGEFAQASGSRGVTISRLDDPYWHERYKTARRMK
jgi:cell wall-associated NlpC family hydrolase